MDVTNRSRGLDLIDRVPEELWTEVPDIVKEAVIKTIPKKKKRKKGKMIVITEGFIVKLLKFQFQGFSLA